MQAGDEQRIEDSTVRSVNSDNSTIWDILTRRLETALGESGPSLVVIPIDYRENSLLTKKLGEITATI